MLDDASSALDYRTDAMLRRAIRENYAPDATIVIAQRVSSIMGLDQIIVEAYHLLGLRTFFTVGEPECRAWTFKEGMKAPQCAGIIHTDFERGFIRAEIYSYEDLMEYKTEPALKEHGKIRLEGKEYVMRDGDIVFFRFNV